MKRKIETKITWNCVAEWVPGERGGGSYKGLRTVLPRHHGELGSFETRLSVVVADCHSPTNGSLTATVSGNTVSAQALTMIRTAAHRWVREGLILSLYVSGGAGFTVTFGLGHRGREISQAAFAVAHAIFRDLGVDLSRVPAPRMTQETFVWAAHDPESTGKGWIPVGQYQWRKFTRRKEGDAQSGQSA